MPKQTSKRSGGGLAGAGQCRTPAGACALTLVFVRFTRPPSLGVSVSAKGVPVSAVEIGPGVNERADRAWPV